MRRAWKCSMCSQICTRKENLKRHSSRLHKGLGKPLLRYILGNSILVPEQTPFVNSEIVFTDEVQKMHFEKPVGPDNRSEKQKSSLLEVMEELFDPNDKVYQPLWKVINFQSRQNHYGSDHQSLRIPIPFPHVHNYAAKSVPTPVTRTNVCEFKEAIVCPDCLGIDFMVDKLEHTNTNMHKCAPGTGNAFRVLGIERYMDELSKSLNFAKNSGLFWRFKPTTNEN